MISWIVATHNNDILRRNLGPALEEASDYGDDSIILSNYPSITEAYTAGQAEANNPVKVYVHHDVQINDYALLRNSLINATEPERTGMVGVIGSRSPFVIPWWNGTVLGSVIDSRMGPLNYGRGDFCALLDGLLLATRKDISWATEAPGWHGYDYDSCLQLLSQGMVNYCISDGHRLVSHNATSGFNTGSLTGWQEALDWYAPRWNRYLRLIQTASERNVPL